MSDNTLQPAAPQQPQFTQQAPAAQPAHGAPVEAPKEEVGGSNRASPGHYLRPDRLHYPGRIYRNPDRYFRDYCPGHGQARHRQG